MVAVHTIAIFWQSGRWLRYRVWLLMSIVCLSVPDLRLRLKGRQFGKDTALLLCVRVRDNPRRQCLRRCGAWNMRAPRRALGDRLSAVVTYTEVLEALHGTLRFYLR
jgi:hypothetical protein